MAGILLGSAAQLGKALNSDVIIEPVRGPLIPGFANVKKAALGAGTPSLCLLHSPQRSLLPLNMQSYRTAGAFGCTISGAGPTCVAVVSDHSVGERVADAMVNAFISEGKLEINSARVAQLDQRGARTIKPY